MTTARIEGALLAGVCAGLAGRFRWNVWALRALFVAFLLFKTFWAIVAYGVLAVILHLADGQWPRRGRSAGGLESPELADRNQRIAELERRFRELEGKDPG
jgi:phage shock protein PspC (stress-responsive transcriptional regulator)